MHERGYKHRDLSPGNILKIANNDGTERYAISDFGLMSPSEDETSTLTASGVHGGTRLFAAPECAINFRRATNQCDIYSIGAILHVIFGGGAARVPYDEITVPGLIGPIVEKCTKRNLHRRYLNVAQLRDELYTVLSNEVLEFSSEEEEKVVELLKEKVDLSDTKWDRVFAQIDDNDENSRSNHTIFMAISIAHIEYLSNNSPELFAALGLDYADYTQTKGFDFDYCDVVASKAEYFYRFGELDLQSKIVVAMLLLGTSHNRWFVEKKFMQLAGTDISDVLAERIVAETEVQEIDLIRQIELVENSINTTRILLHPIIQKAISSE